MSNKSLKLSELTAISSLDGRYRKKVEELSAIVSEYGLIRNRITIEAKFLLKLSSIGITRQFTEAETKLLSGLSSSEKIQDSDIEMVKEIESETRHDVKAVEKMLRKKLSETSLVDQLEMLHLGLTSEDINNLAYRMQLKQAIEMILLPTLKNLINEMVERAEKFKSIPMLARTHGQPAIPTTVGKEFAFFALRLNKQFKKLSQCKLTGKLTGAVGNFNALQYAYPDTNWIKFSEEFISSLDFEPNLITTQINSNDDISEVIQIFQRINGIVIDFDQDMWRYISDNWFVQVIKQGEVGSSTMPQKVNPIDFENSEGRLGSANSMGEYFVRKLPISRLQRDLSDSTVLRDIGSFLANTLIGYKSTLTGLSRVSPNETVIKDALNNDWTILGEGVQTIMRKNGIEDPYSLIASLTKGEAVDPSRWSEWIDSLSIEEALKSELKKLTPENYIGLAVELTNKAIKEIELLRGDEK